MSLLQINSALPLAEPLLEQQQQNEEDVDKDSKQKLKDEIQSRIKFVGLGALTGFLVQVVSLGAYAFILVHFNGMSLRESGVLSMDGFVRTTPTSSDYFGKHAALYTVLSVLTQLDLVVYVLIWVAFTCTMTRSGMKCIRSQFFSSCDKPSTSRRYVFVLGVCFLVGIVVGAFVAWTAIDVYLDFPIPLGPILATVLVDLALCFMMVKCFDMSGTKSTNPSNADDEDEHDGVLLCC